MSSTEPRLQTRKRIIDGGSTDGDGYRGSDSGCADATLFLGYPSRCLINCPFSESEAPCLVGKKIKAGGKK